MQNTLLEILYRQILFFTEDGNSSIEHPNFMIQEVHKISGTPKKEVSLVFMKLVELGFLEKTPDEKHGFRIKTKMDLSEINSRFKDNM